MSSNVRSVVDSYTPINSAVNSVRRLT